MRRCILLPNWGRPVSLAPTSDVFNVEYKLQFKLPVVVSFVVGKSTSPIQCTYIAHTVSQILQDKANVPLHAYDTTVKTLEKLEVQKGSLPLIWKARKPPPPPCCLFVLSKATWAFQLSQHNTTHSISVLSIKSFLCQEVLHQYVWNANLYYQVYFSPIQSPRGRKGYFVSLGVYLEEEGGRETVSRPLWSEW